MTNQLELFQEVEQTKLVGFQNPITKQKALERSVATRKAKAAGEPVVSHAEEEAALAWAEGEFKPTKNMLVILRTALDPDVGTTIKAWFTESGLDRASWYQWNRIPGFKSWWKKAFEENLKSMQAEVVALGYKRMFQDNEQGFLYWKNMMEKCFGYVQKLSIKEEKSENEEALTEELLKLMRRVNNPMQVIDTRPIQDATDVTPELTESDIKELNAPQNI